MWHEARKQEKMIRGMIVDYRRRAERRKDFYEKIKADPTQFMQIHGRPCKIHLDPTVAAAGEGPAIMMPWQGDTNNMIDRFDVRAHLDYIPEVKAPDIPPEDLSTEERQCNYERYRILAQNTFLGISEDKFLQQLAIEEQFGVTIEEKEMLKEKLHEKKGTGVAIGYNYNDPGAQPSCSNGPELKQKEEVKDGDDDSDLEVIDVDLSIDVNKMEASQAHELNAVGPLFGMAGCDLFSFLTGDADDAEQQKQLLREEKEKAMFSGRKSRRERRAHRDKKLSTRVVSPPSYAAPTVRTKSPSRSPSRSPSPEAPESIQYITSFGGEDEEVKAALPPKPSYSEKLKQNLKKVETYSDVVRKPRPRSESRDRYSKSRSLSRSRSRSLSWKRSRSRTRSSSRSYSPRRRSRSRSRSRNIRSRRSRTPTNNSTGYSKRRSRSNSRESNDRPKPLPRYYGRRKEDRSSSELSLDSDSSDSAGDGNKSAVGNKPNSNQNQLRLTGSSSKGPSRETLSLKEKLKRKMQAQLSRQLKADKRAEAERQERESRRQARRDEEMRELAIKLRRKQRELRHQQNRRSSDDGSDSHSGSSSRESSVEKKRDVKSHSRSRSPVESRIPVWESQKEDLSYRHRQEPSDTPHSNLYRKRHQELEFRSRDDRAHEEEKQYQNRYDKYQRGDYNRSEPYNNRNDNDKYDHREDGSYQRRRPFGSRGGQRGHGYGQEYPEGQSSWSRNDSQTYRDQDQPYTKNKVKLVDY